MSERERRIRQEIGRAIARGVGWGLPWIIRISLRRGLRGVWRAGEPPRLPEGAFIMAPNHHSWWDVYLAWLVAERIGRPRIALMERAQLDRFPFFRHVGVLAHDEIRAALARVRHGEILIVFPEGELRASGATGPLHEGVAFFARHADVPVVPVAMRVTLRGASRPEAYVRFGTPLPPGDDLLVRIASGLDGLLDEIDDLLAATHPEDVPPGATRWLGGTASTRERTSWWERLWRR